MEKIRVDSLVWEVVKEHPQTIAVFVQHGMNCVGCDISPLHTVADSAREYALSLEAFLRDLNQALSIVSPVVE